jgi:cytochrome c-type biogenesis protein CcmH
MLWVVFAFMTGAAVLAVLWPLGRRPASVEGAAVDRAFYDAELASIARDRETGLISETEAEAARTEAARRLLAAVPLSASPKTTSRTSIRVAAVSGVLFVPLIALGLYAGLGSPDYPDQPLEARLKAPPGQMDVQLAVAKIEKHLAENPDDAQGWQLLAPVYMRLGRPTDGANAFRNLIRLQGPSAPRLGAYGEALVYAANGQVTVEAREIFERAVAADPSFTQARFFLALAAEQDGANDKAIKAYQDLVAETPDAPWAPMVRERIAALGGSVSAAEPKMPAPSEAGAAAVANLAPEQRDAAIRSMVENLSARLSSQGGDVESWSRLVRAYTVLREPEKAQRALVDGRKALASDAAALQQLETLARELGLGG